MDHDAGSDDTDGQEKKAAHDLAAHDLAAHDPSMTRRSASPGNWNFRPATTPASRVANAPARRR